MPWQMLGSQSAFLVVDIVFRKQIDNTYILQYLMKKSLINFTVSSV